MKKILKIALTFSGIVTGSEIIDEKLAKNFLRKKRANSYRGEEGTAISIDDRTVLILNPEASVAPKVADEVVFRRFQGEGAIF